MRYLMITHIAAVTGKWSRSILWPTEWFASVNAQAKALQDVGIQFSIAAPVHSKIDPRQLAKQPHMEIDLSAQSFDFIPLPGFQTARQFLTVRSKLKKIVADASTQCDAIQIGPGGHPVSLGQTLWPLIRKIPARKVMVFGSDPIAPWKRYASTGRNPAKRAMKQLAVKQLRNFCQAAIQQADLVFATDPAVAAQFSESWNVNCHVQTTHRLPDSEIAPARTPQKRNVLRLICFGSDNYTKGVDHLLRAVGKARRLSAKIEVDLVGDLIGSSELMNLIREESLESAVRLLGKMIPARQILQLDQSDLLVIPNLIPTRDPIIYLAPTRGLPIVMYQGGFFDAQLADNGYGMIIPRGDVHQLAQSLLDLSRNPKRVDEMFAHARQWALSHSLDAMHRNRAELIRKMLQP